MVLKKAIINIRTLLDSSIIQYSLEDIVLNKSRFGSLFDYEIIDEYGNVAKEYDNSNLNIQNSFEDSLKVEFQQDIAVSDVLKTLGWGDYIVPEGVSTFYIELGDWILLNNGCANTFYFARADGKSFADDWDIEFSDVWSYFLMNYAKIYKCLAIDIVIKEIYCYPDEGICKIFTNGVRSDDYDLVKESVDYKLNRMFPS